MKGHANKLALGTNGRDVWSSCVGGYCPRRLVGVPPAPQFGLSGEICSRTNPVGPRLFTSVAGEAPVNFSFSCLSLEKGRGEILG